MKKIILSIIFFMLIYSVSASYILNESFDSGVNTCGSGSYWSTAGGAASNLYQNTSLYYSGGASCQLIAGGTYIFTTTNMTSNMTCAIQSNIRTGTTHSGYVAFETQLSQDIMIALRPTTSTTNYSYEFLYPNFFASSRSLGFDAWQRLAIYHQGNGSIYLYVNGTKIAQGTGNESMQKLWVAQASGVITGSIYYDELLCWNGDLTNEPQMPVMNASYNINITQNPTDLNSTSFNRLNITAYINPVNIHAHSAGSALLFYKIFTALNPCAIYTQRICDMLTDTYKNESMIKINDTLFYSFLNNEQYFPAYYPYNYSIINNNEGLNHSVYLNNNIKFNIYNFSVNASEFILNIEFDAMNTSGSAGALGVYYCNSSYSSGFPAVSQNCELLDTFIPITFRHLYHKHNLSNHFVIPAKIINVKKTQLSYILFIGSSNLANSWDFRYVTHPQYDNTSFNVGSALSWDASNKIFDMHIHPLRENDYLRYYVYYNDNNSTTTQSNIITDFYNISQTPPNSPALITPVCNANYTIGNNVNASIFFNWSDATDVNNDTITYNISLHKESDESHYVLTGGLSISEFTYNASSTIFSNGTYQVHLLSCDAFSCDEGHYCAFSICKNSYTKDTNGCISNIKLISYSDINNCGALYDIPADNGTYEECVSTQHIEISLNIELIINIILILLFMLTLTIGLRSNGQARGIIAISGTIIILYGIIFNIMIKTESEIYYEYVIFGRILFIVFILIGIALIYLGIHEWYKAVIAEKTNNKRQ